MTSDKYRPALTQEEMNDIIDALLFANDASIERAVKEQDAQRALDALTRRKRIGDMLERFSRMVSDRANPKPKHPPVPGQVSMDEEFDTKKARAEAEERSDAIVDHYQSVADDLPADAA